ncbi:MAG: hypothetical protein WDN28_14305 [Chthoniobacter sp.]
MGNLNTTLGANFIVNSLTFDTSSAVGIGGNNLLTLAASGGQGHHCRSRVGHAHDHGLPRARRRPDLDEP